MKIGTKILISPEADPAVLLAWVETEEDLTAIHNAAKVMKSYSRLIFSTTGALVVIVVITV